VKPLKKLAYRFRCWMHGTTAEDWYQRQIEANDFDRDCATRAREGQP
jgi:hypothetical protein